MPPRVLFHLPKAARDSEASKSDEADDADDSAGRPAPGMRLVLDSRRSHHLVRVLRLACGEAIDAFDGEGRSFRATIETADPRRCVIRLGETLARDLESPLRITLAQCISGAERMDWTIEKAVELGAVAIVPLTSARSQVRLDATRAARRLEHWRRIVEAACTQSGRSLLPGIAPVQALEGFVAKLLQVDAQPEVAPRLLVLDPRASRALSQAQIAPGSAVVLLAGPESGLADEEVREACAAGFESIAIGPRTLRTETAGLAAIAALQALAGDF